VIRQLVALSCFVLVSVSVFVPFARAHAAPTGSVVHFFRGPDGDYPNPTLTQDSSGNLYATSSFGGNITACTSEDAKYGCGTVVKLNAPDWSITLLAQFSNPKGPLNPNDGVYLDKTGAVYGTSSYGGAINIAGTFFKLTPPKAGHTVWNQTVLQSFRWDSPTGNLVADGSGSLYVLGYSIGNQNVSWDVLKLTPTSSGSWTSAVVASFPSSGYSGALSPDICAPLGLVKDSSGAFYTVTSDGGDYYNGCDITGGTGAVIKIAPPGKNNSEWSLSTLYTFNFNDGAPASGAVVDPVGNIYGTTSYVQYDGCGDSCGGVVSKASARSYPTQQGDSDDTAPALYMLSRPSASDKWTKSIVTPLPLGNSSVTYSSGSLYVGSRGGVGSTVVKLTRSPTDSTWTSQTLYTFAPHDAWDIDGILVGQNGVIYEAATSTAKTSQGSIVEVKP